MEIPSFLFIGIYITLQIVHFTTRLNQKQILNYLETNQNPFFSMSSLEIYTWQCFPGSGTAKNLRMAAKMSGSFRLREYIPTKNATLHHVRLINMESPWIPLKKSSVCYCFWISKHEKTPWFTCLGGLSHWITNLGPKTLLDRPPRPKIYGDYRNGSPVDSRDFNITAQLPWQFF